MSVQNSASCPKCGLVLRFTPGPSAKVALKCPGCGNLFETNASGSASPSPASNPPKKPAQKKVVVAKVVRAAAPSFPVAPVVSEPEIFECELIEDSVPVFDDAAVQPLARPRLNKPKSTPQTSNKPQQKRQRSSPPKESGRSKWVLPLAIGGACLFAILGGIGLFASGMLSSGGDQENPAVAATNRLNAGVEDYVAALKKVTDGDSRAAAATELAKLETELQALAFEVVRYPVVPQDNQQVEDVRDALTEGAPIRAELIAQSRRVNDNYPLDDELFEVDKRLKSLVHAVEQHLNYSLVELTVSESPVQRICVSTIAIKRLIVTELASLKDSTSLVSRIQQLQRMSDELNTLAEAHSKSGRRISVMAHEYESANRAADSMRQWLVEYVRDNMAPKPELLYTIEEVESISVRVAMAFQAGVSRLATTTKQRVDARLFSINIVPTTTDSTYSSTTAQPASIASSRSPVSKTRQPVDRSTGSSLAAASQPGPVDQKPDSLAGSDLASASTVAPPVATGVQPVAQTPAAGVEPSDSGSGNAAANNGDYSVALQPKARFTGGRSVQIKITGLKQSEVESDFRNLVSMLGVSQSDIAGAGERVTLSFPYTGSLYKVAKMIGFGEVIVCDTQSRTLFIRAN